MVKKFYDIDREANEFCELILSCDARWKKDKLILFSDEACYHLAGYVNSEQQN
jgi:hypothetical protein